MRTSYLSCPRRVVLSNLRVNLEACERDGKLLKDIMFGVSDKTYQDLLLHRPPAETSSSTPVDLSDDEANETLSPNPAGTDPAADQSQPVLVIGVVQLKRLQRQAATLYIWLENVCSN